MRGSGISSILRPPCTDQGGKPRGASSKTPPYGSGRWPWVTGDSVNPAPPYSPCPVLGAILTSSAGLCARWRAWAVKPAVLQLKTFFRRSWKKPEKEASERGWNEQVTEKRGQNSLEIVFHIALLGNICLIFFLPVLCCLSKIYLLHLTVCLFFFHCSR